MREELRFRKGERGAIKIQTALVMLVLVIVVFVAIKITPVYVEQQKVLHDADDLSRVAGLRGYKDEKIQPMVTKLIGDLGLPEDSITYSVRDRRVKVAVAYKRDIDLIVTNYTWQVNREFEHGDF